jgi:hypothetical protein
MAIRDGLRPGEITREGERLVDEQSGHTSDGWKALPDVLQQPTPVELAGQRLELGEIRNFGLNVVQLERRSDQSDHKKSVNVIFRRVPHWLKTHSIVEQNHFCSEGEAVRRASEQRNAGNAGLISAPARDRREGDLGTWREKESGRNRDFGSFDAVADRETE